MRSTPEVQDKEGYTAGLEVVHFSLLRRRNHLLLRCLSGTGQSCLPRKQGPSAGRLMGDTLPLWKAAALAELRTQFKAEADSYSLSQMPQ